MPLQLTTLLPAACRQATRAAGVQLLGADGLQHYAAAKRSDRPAVLAFNHITFIDILLLVGHVDAMPFVGLRHHLEAFPQAAFSRRLRCISVPSSEPGRSVTQQITERAAARRAGEPLLAIAPDAAKCPRPGEPPISPFRSGAFVGGQDVLSVVIRYFPEPPYWPEGQEMGAAILERLTGPPLQAAISLLPAMRPAAGEATAQFRERVRVAMLARYAQMEAEWAASRGGTAVRAGSR